MDYNNGNGVRITNREIYEEVRKIHEALTRIEERHESLALQVKLLWGLLSATFAAEIALVFRMIGG